MDVRVREAATRRLPPRATFEQPSLALMDTTFAKYTEDVLGKGPLLIVGSGVSCGAGLPGMAELAEWLKLHVTPSDADTPTWKTVQSSLDRGSGLEQALLDIGSSLTPTLRDMIIGHTWGCVGRSECAPLLQVASGSDPIKLVALLNRFAHSNNPVLHIITTNYDHLVEWSCAMAGWAVWDGFDRGAIARPVSVEQWGSSLSRRTPAGHGITVHRAHVYKLHGSLSWFRRDESVIKMNGLHHTDLPALRAAGFAPAIVAPGADKYLETHFEPYSGVGSEMRRALKTAPALLFVGFGFNDLHVQAGLAAHLLNSYTPKLILAKKLSSPLRELIKTNRIRGFVAVEEGTAGASAVVSDRIAVREAPANCWTLEGVMTTAWGLET